jgi:hypothetical protein
VIDLKDKRHRKVEFLGEAVLLVYVLTEMKE